MPVILTGIGTQCPNEKTRIKKLLSLPEAKRRRCKCTLACNLFVTPEIRDCTSRCVYNIARL